MKKLKNRFLSCLLSAAMIISMVPSALASGIDAQPLAAGDSITIQEQSITTAATSVTVQVIRMRLCNCHISSSLSCISRISALYVPSPA